MKRSVIIAFVGAAVLLLLLFLLLGRSGRSKTVDWKENYKINNKQPYGIHIVYQMLGEYFPDYSRKDIRQTFVEDLPANPSETSTYMFIGEALFLDSTDVRRLLEFVDNGNTAFIASKSVPYDLMFYVYYNECDYVAWDDYSIYRDTTVRLNLYHSNLEQKTPFEYKYIKEFGAKQYAWNYIDSSYFCGREDGFLPLGAIVAKSETERSYFNFAKIEYKGSSADAKGGTIYFHTNPMAFTNLQMLDKVGKEYAELVFSHLPEGDIYWDSYSQVGEAFSRRMNRVRSQNPNMSLSSESPLKYIIENRHLSWAWFTLLGIGILFLMFRSKRRQRIIPIVAPNTNSSLEYIATMGALYYGRKNHKKICDSKMRNFLAMVRNRFNIPTKRLDDAFAQQLSQRIAVPSNDISQMIAYYQNIMKGNMVSDETLLDFHAKIEALYEKCK